MWVISAIEYRSRQIPFTFTLLDGGMLSQPLIIYGIISDMKKLTSYKNNSPEAVKLFGDILSLSTCTQISLR